MKKQLKQLTVIEALQRQDDGGALEDLHLAIRDVSDAVANSGKGAKGKVVLTLSFQKVGREQLLVTDEVKQTIPAVIKDGTTFFRHPNGGLTSDNPAQGALEGIAMETD